jgi:hypothetical protein
MGRFLPCILADLLDVLFALQALFMQAFGDVAVGIGHEEAKGQVFEFPLDLPDAQAVGQGRKHLQGFAGQRTRAIVLAQRVVAQGLQARGQAQEHHAQVAREGEQHLADALDLLGGQGALGLITQGVAGVALHLHQLAGVLDQAGGIGTEGALDHLLGLVEVLAGIDQVGGGLQCLRRPDAAQDVVHAVGVGQRVFTGVEVLALQQGDGELAGAQGQGPIA